MIYELLLDHFSMEKLNSLLYRNCSVNFFTELLHFKLPPELTWVGMLDFFRYTLRSFGNHVIVWDRNHAKRNLECWRLECADFARKNSGEVNFSNKAECFELHVVRIFCVCCDFFQFFTFCFSYSNKIMSGTGRAAGNQVMSMCRWKFLDRGLHPARSLRDFQDCRSHLSSVGKIGAYIYLVTACFKLYRMFYALNRLRWYSQVTVNMSHLLSSQLRDSQHCLKTTHGLKETLKYATGRKDDVKLYETVKPLTSDFQPTKAYFRKCQLVRRSQSGLLQGQISTGKNLSIIWISSST